MRIPVQIRIMTAAVAGWVGLAQEPTVIRVPVRVVAVPTAVTTADGRSVRGLAPGNFSVFDNGRSQKFRLEYVDAPLSLAMVVQSNSSVRNWLAEVRRIASPLEALVVGATGEASVISFGDEVTLIQPLTSNTALIDKAVASISPRGSGSRCLDAIATAAALLEQASPSHRRVILLAAQAGDAGSQATLRDVIEKLESENITVYSLVMPRIGKDLIGRTVSLQGTKGGGIVGNVDLGTLMPEIYRGTRSAYGQDYLTILTNETGGRQIPFRTLRDLETGISAVGEELHTEYVLSYTPDRSDEGYHRISVAADRPDVSVRSRPGYYVVH